jgi:uncharacterized protein (TIGR02996 family)
VTHHDAFLCDVHDNPDDPTPRLVYADWLEDQGDEESLDRAEFIRGHHALEQWPDEDARRPALLARLDALILKWTRSWVGPFAGAFLGVTSARNYPDHVPSCLLGDGCLTLQFLGGQFLKQRETHFGRGFLGAYLRVSLYHAAAFEPPPIPALAATKELAFVTEVIFHGYRDYCVHPSIEPSDFLTLLADFLTLLASPHWRRLNRLELTSNEKMTDAVATFLASCPNLNRLANLDLSHNHITASAAEVLLTSPRLPRLRRLFFAGNDLSPADQAGLTARFGDRVLFREVNEE